MTTTTVPRGRGRFPPAPIDDAELRRLWPTGERLVDLAKRWGCTKSTVQRRAQQLGLPPRARSTGTLPQNAILRAYVDLGMTLAEIAAQVGASATSIARVLEARGIPRRPDCKRAPDMHAECVRLRRAGLTFDEIAARTGLRRHQVRHRVRKVLGPQPTHRPFASIEALLAMRARGMSYREIAAKVERTRQTVQIRIRRALARRATATTPSATSSTCAVTRASSVAMEGARHVREFQPRGGQAAPTIGAAG